LSKFPKKERLASKKLIKELFSKGSSFFLYPIKSFYFVNYPQAPEVNQVIISIPKKNFKSAVKRNLLKRRIREAYRLNKHILQNQDASLQFLVGFVYISKDILSYKEIESKLKTILKRLSEHKLKNIHKKDEV
jgi:ribonuclease P protein component